MSFDLMFMALGQGRGHSLMISDNIVREIFVSSRKCSFKRCSETRLALVTLGKSKRGFDLGGLTPLMVY